MSSYVVPNLYEFLSSAELFDYPCSSKYLLCSAEEKKKIIQVLNNLTWVN